MNSSNLTHHFLIAMPSMEDSHFANALVYIAEHNEGGALGIVVNRPSNMKVKELFERVEIPLHAPGFGDLPVYMGGPVQTHRGFVLYRTEGQWQACLRVNDEVSLCSSKDILESIGASGKPEQVIITHGYSSWDAGQLENELLQNAWLTVSASASILFDLPPEARMGAAMERLGVSFPHLSLCVGHA